MTCFPFLQLEISSASLDEKASRTRLLLLILILAVLIQPLWAAEKGLASYFLKVPESFLSAQSFDSSS